MTFLQIIWTLACVAIIASGQLLFKKAGLDIQAAGTWWSPRALITVFCALVIYAVATLLWINLLRFVSLNRAYSFMALCFVIVPIASHFAFGESLTRGYLIGTVMIMCGLIVTSRFG
jgi:drug/metabolite transporter (DMT)-like permease